MNSNTKVSCKARGSLPSKILLNKISSQMQKNFAASALSQLNKER